MVGDNVLSYGLPCDKMLLDDPLQHIRSAIPVPGTVGVDNGDWSPLANLQTIGLGSIDTPRACKTQLL